jgi:hypothetical protein
MNTEQIEKLKKSWRKDPCWNIEDTEGFEDHKEELIAFRQKYELQKQTAAEYKAQTRQKNFANSTGIDNYDLAQTLKTFSEIERQVYSCVDANSDAAVAQVRATLLLAAEVKRIADILSCFVEKDDES